MSTFWDDAAGVLGKVAPMLATAVGGPLAGAATSAIIGALGLAPDTTAQQAAAAVVGATPDQLIALKKADEDFAEKMGQLNLDTAKLGFDDIANARAREATVKDHTPAIMGYILLVGSLGAAGAVLAGIVPDTSLQAGVVLGYLFSEAKQVLSYYFGSSSSSEAKTAMIYNSTPGAPVHPLAP
jgi:hypothetical protein